MVDPRIINLIPEWVDACQEQGRNILATSNQGVIFLYEEDDVSLVIKTAMGTGILRRARQATLRREFQAYQRLSGMAGVAKCFAYLQDRYLVLEHIRGEPFRNALFENRTSWFDELLKIIREFHRRGVAHGDLKSKSNLLNTVQGTPCVIDFGTAVSSQEGFHPINNRMFDYLKRLDLNAWVKHKYHGCYEDVSAEDRELLDYSGLEGALRRYRRWRDA